MKHPNFLEAVGLGVLLLFITLSTAGADMADFYVATNGNDNNPGTKARPFATLQRASNAVRRKKAGQAPCKPITVMLRGGKYFIDKTLVLRAEDGGTKGCPITYTAYPGEEPVLSGGRKLTNWKPYDGNIYQGSSGAGLAINKSRWLFFNGQHQIRARTPNRDPKDHVHGGWAFAEGPGPNATTSFQYKSGAFSHLPWSKPRLAEVLIFPGINWEGYVMPVASIDIGSRLITLTRSTVHPKHEKYQPNSRYRVENVLEELDEAGEWCLDTENQKVYFWPPEPLDGNSEVVIPTLDCLIDLNGVSHITISGFTFTETTGGDSCHYLGVLGCGVMGPRAGWDYCGEALRLKNAEHCIIENNYFHGVSGNGVYLIGHTIDNLVRYNKFKYVGANGVVLVGTSPSSKPVSNHVVDNYFQYTGSILIRTAGVMLGLSDDNLIAHNVISDAPYHGICLGSNLSGRNILEYNDIRRVCLQTQDNTAINAWMDQAVEGSRPAGHIIRYNYIADIPGCWQHANETFTEGVQTSGIYLDNKTSNCKVHGNIIVRTGHGIDLHGGKNNIIENNIIYQGNLGMYAHRGPWSKMSDMFKNNSFCRNIVCVDSNGSTSPYKNGHFLTFSGYDGKVLADSNYNLFHNPIDGHKILIREDGVKSWAQWQALGHDKNSVIADPLFVDAERDDYRLKPESPALKLGFQPIDISRIGVRKSKSE